MSVESWDAAVQVQSAEIQPVQEFLLEEPAPDVPPPTPEEVRADDVVFSRDQENAAAGLIGAWGAGMLAQEMIGDHLSRKEEEKENDERTAGKHD